MNVSNKQKNDSNYQDYLNERKLLIQAKLEEAKLFDKSILTLSAGAFGLSLTFYEKIVPDIKCGTELLLICAWIGFGMSMITILISIFTSRLACLRQIEILESTYLHTKKGDDSHKNYPAILTNILNITSMVVFIVGVIFLAVFSIVNLLNQ
jgi:hypothetical protein